MVSPCHGLEHSFQLRRTMGETSTPEGISRILNKLDEGDQETPLIKQKDRGSEKKRDVERDVERDREREGNRIGEVDNHREREFIYIILRGKRER